MCDKICCNLVRKNIWRDYMLNENKIFIIPVDYKYRNNKKDK